MSLSHVMNPAGRHCRPALFCAAMRRKGFPSRGSWLRSEATQTDEVQPTNVRVSISGRLRRTPHPPRCVRHLPLKGKALGCACHCEERSDAAHPSCHCEEGAARRGNLMQGFDRRLPRPLTRPCNDNGGKRLLRPLTWPRNDNGGKRLPRPLTRPRNDNGGKRLPRLAGASLAMTKSPLATRGSFTFSAAEKIPQKTILPLDIVTMLCYTLVVTLLRR